MQTELIYNLWYVAAWGGSLAHTKTVSLTLLGQQILLGRDANGGVFALRDFCPHRGIPLRYGTFDGTTLECCYHGWCFNTQGQCTAIPALPEDDKTDISRIKAQSYPCREVDGLVWVYVSAPGTRAPQELPEIPTQPTALLTGYRHVESVVFPCDIDHAVLGLMDPSHGPYVHASWWWRTQRSMHIKEKKFAPHGLGFKMVSHKPSSNSRAYKILFGGEAIETEIAFQLPGLRTEHIRVGKHHIALLTALTPIDESRTQLHQFIYTSIPLINILLPLLKIFGRAFIKQDLEIVKKQQEGLQGQHPGLMLIGDADQQARWYHKLKRDYLASQQAGIAFENPVPEKTLRWRS